MLDFFRKKGRWKNKVLIEGEKEAMVLSQLEGYPEVNHDFDAYPLDVTLPEKLTFWDAVKRAIWFSERCIYNLIVRDNTVNSTGSVE